MSYRTAQWQDLWAWASTWVFSQWYVDNTPSLYLPSWASPYLRNVRLDWNTAAIRPWHVLFKSISSVWMGIWSYLRSSDNLDRLIVRENYDDNVKLVLYREDWDQTEVDTWANILSDNKMDFININDEIYCMNWEDVIGKVSWSTYSKLDTSKLPSATFSPAFWVVFNGCMWVSWWKDNANVVYKSLWWIYNADWTFKVPAYNDFKSLGSDQFTFQEQITWLCANAQALFYFTRNTVSVTGQSDYSTVEISWWGSRVSYNTSVLTVKEWAINHYWIVWVGNDVYYITPTNKICKIIRWNNVIWYEVQDLSWRKYAWCEGIMHSIAKDQTDCWWYYVPKEDVIKWFFKSEWSNTHDVCVIYDVEKDKFLVDTWKYFSWWINFKWKVYTLSEIEPKLYEDEVWLEDDDSPIPFEYWTKEFYISDPSFKKIFWESRLVADVNLNANLRQEIWIDEQLADTKIIKIQPDTWWWIWTFATGTSMVWVEIEADSYTDDLDYQELVLMRTKWNLNIRWRKIQFRYYNTEVWSKVRLKNLSLKVEVLPELTNNLSL